MSDRELLGWVKIEEVRQHFDTAGCGTIYKTGGEGRVPLYSAPQREWVGLTKKERIEIGKNLPLHFSTLDVAYAIEAKLKEKNSTSDKNIQTSDNKPPKSTQGEG